MSSLSKFSYLTAVLLLLFAFSSCEKKLTDEEQLLTSHIWKWTERTTTRTEQWYKDYIADMNTENASQRCKFLEGGTFTINDLDNPNDPPITNSWELKDGNTVLVLNGNNWTIIKIAEDEIVLEIQTIENYPDTLFFTE